MTKEPTTTPMNEESNRPATHGDLDLWGGQLQSEINDLKEEVTGLKQGQERLEQSQLATLELVKSIDQQLREWKHIPVKVERLHARVFGTHD